MKIQVVKARNKKYNGKMYDFGKVVDSFESHGTIYTQFESIKIGSKYYTPSTSIGKRGSSATLCLDGSHGIINFDEIIVL